jgi:predicted helicase
VAEREGDAPATDTGIDLVARIRGSADDWCAIQCKCFSADHRIQRRDIDSFFTESGRRPFTRRILVDTTEVPLGTNAQALFNEAEAYVPAYRIGLNDLESSRIDWSAFGRHQEIRLKVRKTPRPDQREALDAIHEGFAAHDRGKLIMACGTGKTFVALKAAEERGGVGGRVLLMVPSLALMAQSVTEWSNDSELPLRSFAVCSDVQVGKRAAKDDTDLARHDLAFPATTSGRRLAEQASDHDDSTLTVVFATYQSIQAVTEAQQHGLPDFDLVICDEAHRTTGVTLAEDADETDFVRVHDNDQVRAAKRLYMTATPRIYTDRVKSKAAEGGHELATMDDEAKYGPLFFHRGFSWAVENELLTDYKVIILAMDEGLVSRGLQKALSADDNELALDDASRIIGCYKALAKQGLQSELAFDPQPMRRALAFCRDIKRSKLIESEFGRTVDAYFAHQGSTPTTSVAVQHVDGTFGAKARTCALDWLKAAGDEGEIDECRVLTNARCLSEGVDVPALDAILFLHPRKSQIDVVQSVGRVMRRAEGKRMGYVILPIGVPEGVAPAEALNDNKRYQVVWQILNALRAHDERLDATINQASLGEDVSGRIQVTGVNHEELAAVTAEVEELPTRSKPVDNPDLGGGAGGDDPNPEPNDAVADDRGTYATQQSLDFNAEVSEAIMAKLVQRCGTRDYWEDWATDIARIAEQHVQRIHATLAEDTGEARAAFDAFLAELRDDLNDQITEGEAVEMLAQHLITRPVFDVLFEGYAFTRQNPVSQAIERVLAVLDEHNLDKESASLEQFYASVQRRAAGIETAHGKQRLVVELYDKFFRKAFPRLTERLGIVYTPVEVVDFIIRSVNDVLADEFDATLGSEGVHIIDPFVGTGTFITRLLQSGLISPNELAYKYNHEIHANEIVLLAYYIAGINIEAVYHEMQGGEYKPFEGICLTDTFQMYEADDLVSELFEDNSERRKRQKGLDIRVIMGNPPYAYKQGSANDDNQVVKYPHLDERIANTYVANASATRTSAVYNSYIRAIRWGSDRLGKKGGVMAYVTDASWLDGNAMAGVRHCLAEEFSSLYIFHLRGLRGQRTQGERAKQEGGQIFGSGSGAAIAITVFVKNPAAAEHGHIHFHDIGDYLSADDKKALIAEFGSVNGIANGPGWKAITPNAHADWLNKRDDAFYSYMPLGAKKKTDETQLFESYSCGVVTSRDAWCYNPSRDKLETNMQHTIDFYNSEVDRYEAAGGKSIVGDAKAFADKNPKKISWDRVQFKGIENGRRGEFNATGVMPGMYRPFSKTWMYFDRFFNNCVYQMPKIFPTADVENGVIAVAGVGASDFSLMMFDQVPCFDAINKSQCFPRYIYEAVDNKNQMPGWDDGNEDGAPAGYRHRDGITDAGLAHIQSHYPGETITKDDVFDYVYGLLHSPDYRERFANNLSRDLPRIPCVASAEDFRAFVDAGRALGTLHVDYERVEPYPVDLHITGDKAYEDLTADDLRVNKPWKFTGKSGNKDRTRVHYNDKITITGVPVEAYDYVVNGKPALQWVMECQIVKTDKASGIVSDANDYAVETMGDPAYPLKLFQRVITVSLETQRIVSNLPKLDMR